MPEVSAGHEGHEPGTYSALCRSCRMGADLERIKEIGTPAVPGPMEASVRVSEARSFVGRFVWTGGQLDAIQKAAAAGVSMREFAEWVGASRREVVGERR